MKRIYKPVLVFCLATFLLFTSVSTAPAKEAGPVYVGVFGGYVIPRDLRVEDGGSVDVGVKNSWAIGAKVGYIFPQARWLAVELEYFYLSKQDIDQPGTDGDFRSNNVMANILWRYPEGKIHPYAGGGLGWSGGTIEITSAGHSTEANGNGFAWQLLAGVNFEITPNWSADLAYRYIRIKYNDFISDPSADVTSQNNLFLLGINYHF
jgi:opacity protein-like surface antigen